ncbi:hypothetical protein NDU88_008876, partial [Pleurodeles waltl]
HQKSAVPVSAGYYCSRSLLPLYPPFPGIILADVCCPCVLRVLPLQKYAVPV